MDEPQVLTKLVNAQAMHAAHPEFSVPSDHELMTITNDDFVKLCRHGERFWLRVVANRGEFLLGEINNDLCLPDNAQLTIGQIVKFRHCHVYAIAKPGVVGGLLS